MLTNCVNCEFYVRPDDEFCLNCGIESPTKEFSKPSIKVIPLTKMSQSKFVKVIFSLFLTFFFLYTIADWDISKILYLQDYIFDFNFNFRFRIVLSFHIFADKMVS